MASRTGVVAAAESSADRLNAGQTKSQLEPNAPGEDTPENILRVSRGTSFEGLKSAYRLAMEAAETLEGGEAEKKARKEKVEWAFDALIDESRAFFQSAVERDPSDADAKFRLGNFYQTLGKNPEAEAEGRATQGRETARTGTRRCSPWTTRRDWADERKRLLNPVECCNSLSIPRVAVRRRSYAPRSYHLVFILRRYYLTAPRRSSPERLDVVLVVPPERLDELVLLEFGVYLHDLVDQDAAAV